MEVNVLLRTKQFRQPDQNYYFSANQNAKRLHGSDIHTMYSPPVDRWIPYMSTRFKKQTPKKSKNARKGRGSGLQRVSSQRIPLGVAQRRTTKAPRFQNLNSSDGSLVVRHEEFAFDVTPTSSAFTVLKALPLNPGNEDIMPWMSRVSTNYESYVFEALEIEYRPLAPATTNGGIYLVVDYDVADSTPTDKVEFMAMHGAQRQSIWAPIVMRCDKKDLKKLPQRYVLNDLPPTGTDARIYNTGTMYIATDGVGGSSPVGEIYVKYSVKLMTPQLGGRADSGSIVLPGAQPALTQPFGNQTLASVVGNAAKILTQDTIQFADKGKFLVDMTAAFTGGTPSTASAPTLSVGGGAGTIFGGNGNVPYNNGTSSNYQAIIDVIQNPLNLVANYTPWAGSATGIASTRLKVAKYIGSSF